MNLNEATRHSPASPLPSSSGYLHSVARVKRFLSEKKDANSNRWAKSIKKENQTRVNTRNVKRLQGLSRAGVVQGELGQSDRRREAEFLFICARICIAAEDKRCIRYPLCLHEFNAI